jgi:flagellar assembly factor FliW
MCAIAFSFAVRFLGCFSARSPRKPARRAQKTLAAKWFIKEEKAPAMEIQTTRFGTVGIEAEDIIHFPTGLLGLESCRHWVLLADAENDALGWLQSTARADVALAVVSPRRFRPDYQVRVGRSELAPLALKDVKDAKVLAIVGKNERGITLNLKAPLVINLEQRLGRQVVTNGDHPVQFELGSDTTPLKKIA